MPPMDFFSASINMILIIVLFGIFYFVLKSKKDKGDEEQ